MVHGLRHHRAGGGPESRLFTRDKTRPRVPHAWCARTAGAGSSASKTGRPLLPIRRKLRRPRRHPRPIGPLSDHAPALRTMKAIPVARTAGASPDRPAAGAAGRMHATPTRSGRKWLPRPGAPRRGSGEAERATELHYACGRELARVSERLRGTRAQVPATTPLLRRFRCGGGRYGGW